jgi:hypothetical protein
MVAAKQPKQENIRKTIYELYLLRVYDELLWAPASLGADVLVYKLCQRLPSVLLVYVLRTVVMPESTGSVKWERYVNCIHRHRGFQS